MIHNFYYGKILRDFTLIMGTFHDTCKTVPVHVISMCVYDFM